MKTEMDWQAYVRITRREYIKRYATCAKENTQDANVLKTELDNILEAANRAREQQLYEVPLEIARWLWIDGGRFLDLQAYTEVSLELLAQALDAARLLKSETQEEELLGQMGRAWLAARDSETASQFFQEALKLAEKLGDSRGMASHLGCLGQIYLDQKDVENAEKCFQRALMIAEEIADRQLEGRQLGSMGLLCAAKSDYSKAIEYYELAINIAEKERDWQGKASHLGAMGTAYQILGIQNPPEKVQGWFQGEMVTYPYEYIDNSRQRHYYSEAKKYFQKALNIAKRRRDKIKKKEYEANLEELQRLEKS